VFQTEVRNVLSPRTFPFFWLSQPPLFWVERDCPDSFALSGSLVSRSPRFAAGRFSSSGDCYDDVERSDKTLTPSLVFSFVFRVCGQFCTGTTIVDHTPVRIFLSLYHFYSEHMSLSSPELTPSRRVLGLVRFTLPIVVNPLI